MNGWDSFFLASAGASAALAGLIFVGVSLSLSEILKTRTLPSRAAISLMLLVMVLINSLLALVPGQSYEVHGFEILLIGIFIWLLVSRHNLIVIKFTEKNLRKYQIWNSCFDQSALLLVIFSGVMIVMNGDAGIYWIVPGFIIAFAKSVSDAWVLLVEINR